MDGVRFPKGFSLEAFADFFISEVVDCLRGRKSVDVAKMYAVVEKNVGGKMGISEESVRHIHHCFHWELFLGENPKIEYSQDGNGTNYARLLRDISDDERRTISRVILKDYGEYLRARVNQLTF